MKVPLFPYSVKVATDEGSSLHLYPQREQEDPSISSATKDWADSQRPRREKPISLLALEKCRGMKREIEVNRETWEFFFSPGVKEGSWAAVGGVSLFLMGKCHSIALAVLFTGPLSLGF